ncbi:MAG TPA: exosortase-associated EpsI family protein, partial [Cellvibrionaceae bacterium]|nr:exosortase-associated EpsI family protein [Cellvibrionaceae bacterium]
MRNLWLLLAMVLCAGAAIAITPRHKIADRNPMPNLSTIIPQQFGQWKQIPGSNQIIDPGQAQKLNSIYDQVYARTFENKRGYRVM